MTERILTYYLVAFSLAHAALGCCFHHAHAQDAAFVHDADLITHEHSCADDHAVGEAHQRQSEVPSQPAPEPVRCPEAPCVFMAPDRLAAPTDDSTGWAMASWDSCGMPARCSASSHSADMRSAILTDTPVRLHLALSILLI
ncbi:MAG: hypothetical protein KatS3mg111_2233 [Pirellulaceae bacterium]|nr:MAG: hypothetical protein KatS3mg111_2233 [Pirellulaceae bacterium]